MILEGIRSCQQQYAIRLPSHLDILQSFNFFTLDTFTPSSNHYQRYYQTDIIMKPVLCPLLEMARSSSVLLMTTVYYLQKQEQISVGITSCICEIDCLYNLDHFIFFLIGPLPLPTLFSISSVIQGKLLFLENHRLRGDPTKKRSELRRKLILKVRGTEVTCTRSLALGSRLETCIYRVDQRYLLCHSGGFIRISSFILHLSKCRHWTKRDSNSQPLSGFINRFLRQNILSELYTFSYARP